MLAKCYSPMLQHNASEMRVKCYSTMLQHNATARLQGLTGPSRRPAPARCSRSRGGTFEQLGLSRVAGHTLNLLAGLSRVAGHMINLLFYCY